MYRNVRGQLRKEHIDTRKVLVEIPMAIHELEITFVAGSVR